jgi:TonB family protein
LIREVESNLSRRIGVLEGEVAEQTRKIQETRQIGMSNDESDQRFKQMFAAMATVWSQAPSQPPLLPAPTLPAPAPAEAAATPAKRSRHSWLVGVVMAAAAVALSFETPALQSTVSRYMIGEAMPAISPKAPAAPALPAAKARPPKPEKPAAAPKPPQRFEGPQIALEIPADVRAKVPAEARVQVVVAIDEQGNVTNAEVESMMGKGAGLLTKQALDAARRARFRPAREGERAIESQMVLTYLFNPDSADF